MQFAAFPGAGISIHALREEGDASASSTSTAPPNFYPRPPRGGRRCGAACFHLPDMISIHALREEGDAYEPFHLREKIEISIHALREEGDS